MEPMEHSMSHLLYNQVDQIADVKTCKINDVETKYYKVQWKCTWEPETVLEQFCGNIIEEYRKSTDIDLHTFPDNFSILNKQPLNLKIQKSSIDKIKNDNDNTTSINITDKVNNPIIFDDIYTARNITDKVNNPTIFDSTTPAYLTNDIQAHNGQYNNINKSIDVVLSIKPDPETDFFPNINILDDPANRKQCDLVLNNSPRVADNLIFNGDSFVGDVEMSQTVNSIENNEVNTIYSIGTPTLKRPTMSDLASSNSFGATNINYNNKCKFNKDVENNKYAHITNSLTKSNVTEIEIEKKIRRKNSNSSGEGEVSGNTFPIRPQVSSLVTNGYSKYRVIAPKTVRNKLEIAQPKPSQSNQILTISPVENNDTDSTVYANKRFRCELCSYSSPLSSNVKRHMRRHTGQKPYKCNQCSYSAVQKHHLTLHSFKHGGEKPFKCDKCSFTTSQKSVLKVHMVRHEGKPK